MLFIIAFHCAPIKLRNVIIQTQGTTYYYKYEMTLHGHYVDNVVPWCVGGSKPPPVPAMCHSSPSYLHAQRAEVCSDSRGSNRLKITVNHRGAVFVLHVSACYINSFDRELTGATYGKQPKITCYIYGIYFSLLSLSHSTPFPLSFL